MKTTIALVALVALASSAVACSSSNGNSNDIDTGTALSSLRTPTGSFSEATAGKAFGSYRSNRANSSKISTPGATVGSDSAGTRTASIRLLDNAAASCGGGQACACPNGGSLTYGAEKTADTEAIKVSFDGCGFEDGWAFDGKAVLLASKKSLLGGLVPASSVPASGAASGSDTGAGSAIGSAGAAFGSEYVAILLAAKGTVSKGVNRLELDLALVAEAHYAFLAVEVGDGKVVVGVSDDGHAIVKSKEGTWTCNTVSNTTGNGWTCTSDSGKTITATEEAGDSASASDDTASADVPSAPMQP